MIYCIGAFFVGLGVIAIAGAIIFGCFMASDFVVRALNRRFKCNLIALDLAFISLFVFTACLLGSAILSRF